MRCGRGDASNMGVRPLWKGHTLDICSSRSFCAVDCLARSTFVAHCCFIACRNFRIVACLTLMHSMHVHQGVVYAWQCCSCTEVLSRMAVLKAQSCWRKPGAVNCFIMVVLPCLHQDRVSAALCLIPACGRCLHQHELMRRKLKIINTSKS